VTGEPGGPLWWGRRFLLCPPTHFGVAYEINPWMSTKVNADPARALAQWEDLVDTLRAAGAEIETQTPIEGLPDLVFTANAGLVDGRRFLPSRFRHPERQGETAHDIEWFERRGFELKKKKREVLG
jgi:N-dimethylarginine dimethylaminohydrolase